MLSYRNMIFCSDFTEVPTKINGWVILRGGSNLVLGLLFPEFPRQYNFGPKTQIYTPLDLDWLYSLGE